MDINKLSGAIPATVIAQIPNVMTQFSVNTPLRLGHFLSQCGHESWNFTATVENLNYSEEALNRVFHKYFPDDLAKSYARQGQRIGSRVYANRMGNGDEASGEGFKYRGRGFIQLTGKVNYASFDKLVEENIIEQPELVATKYPLLSAAWYWNSRNLNAIADLGDSDAVVTRITKVVNGGMNGYDDRLKLFKKFYPILNAS
jgi:putative chitinase